MLTQARPRHIHRVGAYAAHFVLRETIMPFKLPSVLKRPRESRSRALWLMAALAAYWAAGYTPFYFVPPWSWQPNGASQDPASGTLSWPAPGFALTGVRWQAGAERLQLRLEAVSYVAPQSGPARLVSLAPNTLERYFSLAQRDADLVLRLRRGDANRNGMPELVAPGVLAPGRLMRTRLVIDADGSAHWRVNGRLLAAFAPGAVDLARWTRPWPLILGNEATVDRPWLGELRSLRLTVDGETLFDLSRALELPAGSWQPSARLQRLTRYQWLPLTEWKPHVPLDFLVNFVGFVPFGLLLVWLWPRFTPGWCALLAALLSASIELGQIAFAGRFPTGNDLLANTLGGMLGGYIGQRLSTPRRVP